MASFQKTFRKSGSHHAEFHSLQGVEVKIGEKFRPPKKVTLPVGWQQKDPSAALSLTYDFTLENEVVSKAEAQKASKQEQSENSSTELQATSTSVETVAATPTTNQNSIFSNVGSEILQPVAAPGMGHKKKDSFGGKGKNAFDISDFEGDTSTPFELVELQTINDLDELKNVLQPNAVPVTTTEDSSCSFDSKSNAPLASMSGNSINLPENTVSSSGTSLVDISGLNIVDRASAPPGRSPDYMNLPATNNVTEPSALLVDIGEARTASVTPAASTVSTNNSYIHNNSLSSTSFISENRPLSRGGLLPPIGQSFPATVPQQPQGHQSFAIPTHSSVSRNSFPSGTYSFPNSVSPSQGQQQTIENQEANTQYRQYSPRSCVSTSRDQQWSAPRSPDYQNVGGRYSFPLPPIGMSSEEPHSRQSDSYQSSLPDPWPILNDSEKSFARTFVGMGFPTPRVARAVQRLGTNEKEVIEFLVTVDELCENKNYTADSVEVALVFNSEKAKAVEFLELVKTFKEYGFKEENIHECLRAADNDSEKALEYLMTLNSS